MIQGVIIHVPDLHELEAPVGAEGVVTPRPQHSALPKLCPRLKVAVTVPFPEVVHQVDEAKLRQYIGDKLDAEVLGIIRVHVEVSHQDRVLTPETLQCLLLIGEVDQRGKWEVRYNEWGPVHASDDLVAYHVQPVEVRLISSPSCWPVLQDHRHASLRCTGAGGTVF